MDPIYGGEGFDKEPQTVDELLQQAEDETNYILKSKKAKKIDKQSMQDQIQNLKTFKNTVNDLKQKVKQEYDYLTKSDQSIKLFSLVREAANVYLQSLDQFVPEFFYKENDCDYLQQKVSTVLGMAIRNASLQQELEDLRYAIGVNSETIFEEELQALLGAPPLVPVVPLLGGPAAAPLVPAAPPLGGPAAPPLGGPAAPPLAPAAAGVPAAPGAPGVPRAPPVPVVEEKKDIVFMIGNKRIKNGVITNLDPVPPKILAPLAPLDPLAPIPPKEDFKSQLEEATRGRLEKLGEKKPEKKKDDEPEIPTIIAKLSRYVTQLYNLLNKNSDPPIENIIDIPNLADLRNFVTVIEEEKIANPDWDRWKLNFINYFTRIENIIEKYLVKINSNGILITTGIANNINKLFVKFKNNPDIITNPDGKIKYKRVTRTKSIVGGGDNQHKFKQLIKHIRKSTETKIPSIAIKCKKLELLIKKNANKASPKLKMQLNQAYDDLKIELVLLEIATSQHPHEIIKSLYKQGKINSSQYSKFEQVLNAKLNKIKGGASESSESAFISIIISILVILVIIILFLAFKNFIQPTPKQRPYEAMIFKSAY